jgi:hypothetical protein
VARQFWPLQGFAEDHRRKTETSSDTAITAGERSNSYLNNKWSIELFISFFFIGDAEVCLSKGFTADRRKILATISHAL